MSQFNYIKLNILACYTEVLLVELLNSNLIGSQSVNAANQCGKQCKLLCFQRIFLLEQVDGNFTIGKYFQGKKMDFNELITDFATRHGVEGLAIEDGTAAIDVDGIAIAFAENGDGLVATAVIGEPPVEGRADFADLLLEANLGADAFFAKSRESNRYVLIRRLALIGLDGAAFDAAVESLVNFAETWCRLLEDFRPAARSAVEANTDGSPADGFSPFMQV